MNMTISVSRDDAQRLATRAAAEGKNVEALVLDAIHEKLTHGPKAPAPSGSAEWMRSMNEWISDETPVPEARVGKTPGWGEWALYSTRMS